MIPIAVRELIGFSAIGGKNIKVIVLAAAVRAVEDALAVRRPLRFGAVKCFLAQDHLGAAHAIRLGSRAPYGARAERDAAVRYKQDLLAIGRPGRLDVVIESVEIQSRMTKAVRFGQLQRLSGPVVLHRHGIDMEPAAGLVPHERQSLAIRRPCRIEVEILARCQRRALAGGEIQQHQINATLILGRVGDRAAVRRPGRGGVVGAIGREFIGHRVAETDLPDGAGHGKRKLLAVRRPGGTPGRTRGGRNIVAVHVAAGISRSRGVRWRRPDQGYGQYDQKPEVHHVLLRFVKFRPV